MPKLLFALKLFFEFSVLYCFSSNETWFHPSNPISTHWSMLTSMGKAIPKSLTVGCKATYKLWEYKNSYNITLGTFQSNLGPQRKDIEIHWALCMRILWTAGNSPPWTFPLISLPYVPFTHPGLSFSWAHLDKSSREQRNEFISI